MTEKCNWVNDLDCNRGEPCIAECQICLMGRLVVEIRRLRVTGAGS